MTVGILGGGQLGRMLALAGYPLGLRFRFLDPNPDAPAGHLGELHVGNFTDPAVLDRFADGLSVATFEFENVPLDAARRLSERVPVYPPPAALDAGQDRSAEKHLFERVGVPVPPWQAVDSHADLKSAAAAVGLPAVMKTRRLGYDGKGQFVLREPADVDHAWETLAGGSFVLEKFVPFDREVSIIAVRRRNGDTRFYPLVENHHRLGILRWTRAPAPNLSDALQRIAERHATNVLDALSYVGVLAIEFFEKDGELIANEMAPRVHNSGHWTIEGARTSQFANHIRAILDLPLGDTAAVGHSAMLNIIGTLPNAAECCAVPEAHLHLYGKAPRPERKLGHLTFQSPDANRIDSLLAEWRAKWRE